MNKFHTKTHLTFRPFIPKWRRHIWNFGSWKQAPRFRLWNGFSASDWRRIRFDFGGKFAQVNNYMFAFLFFQLKIFRHSTHTRRTSIQTASWRVSRRRNHYFATASWNVGSCYATNKKFWRSEWFVILRRRSNWRSIQAKWSIRNNWNCHWRLD